MIAWLALAALVLAALPACLGAVNLIAMRSPAIRRLPDGTLVSILIPARNEEGNIGAAVEAALRSTGVAVEVVVMDDGSTDSTPAIVAELAARDPRVRLEGAPPLPEGWTGKVHACFRLAQAARGTHLLFVDADVRLEPGAAAALVSHAVAAGTPLVSAVPRQIMRSPGELLTVPSINLLMLGYLPVPLMRTRPDPSLGAACGQMLLAEREAYAAVGGHEAIRTRIHDGLQLARVFRESGRRTDVVAGARLATCRMYRGFGEAWAGFAKNAHEAMATPRALPVWTVLLFGGHVLPLPLVIASGGTSVPAWAALALSLGLRAAVTLATRENPWSIPLHPATVLTGLAIQWTALARNRRGRPAGWKGRLYPAG
ncbi:glycosyltransferase [Salinarimonas soli]|uniref:Glycosyltransferase n=1 Tax=Salinarimonas soli TaxID=1638099 RepID=A0A5B2VII3_9HYPH|nr:glycosyltransferase family A protein [Salinarimonas soli]KAA2238320.1 glycosyltransferase [Salinarimonas soli]